MPDDLTATLEQIKAGAEGWIIDNDGDCSEVGVSCIGHNTRRAVAALEAVLKEADDFELEAAKQERNAAASDELGGMIIPAAQRARAQTHRDCARSLREAITRALNGDTDA